MDIEFRPVGEDDLGKLYALDEIAEIIPYILSREHTRLISHWCKVAVSRSHAACLIKLPTRFREDVAAKYLFVNDEKIIIFQNTDFAKYEVKYISQDFISEFYGLLPLIRTMLELGGTNLAGTPVAIEKAEGREAQFTFANSEGGNDIGHKYY